MKTQAQLNARILAFANGTHDQERNRELHDYAQKLGFSVVRAVTEMVEVNTTRWARTTRSECIRNPSIY